MKNPAGHIANGVHEKTALLCKNAVHLGLERQKFQDLLDGIRVGGVS
jgi:hypothetical protein